MANRGLSAVSTQPTTTPKFEEKSFEIRGQSYKIRELTSSEYDKLYKQAEQEDGDVDTAMLLRLMTLKSVVDPQINADDLGGLPMRVSRALLREVNELHFGDEVAKDTSPKNA